MRLLKVFAFVASLVAPVSAYAAGQCGVPIPRLVESSDYFSKNMTIHDQTNDSVTLTHKDDPRIVISFTTEIPYPSDGLSKSEYIGKYEKELNGYAASAKGRSQQVETSFYTTTPLSWKIVEKTSLPDIGPAFRASAYIRLSETCLVKASFISPDSQNLATRWIALNGAVDDIRSLASPFVQTTVWEREDTAPVGATAIAVGFVAPLLLVGILFHFLGHFTRLDPPTLSTKTTTACLAFMAAGFLFYQRSMFLAGFPILKYTDGALLLSICAAVCLASMVFAQRATLLALIFGGVAGASSVASASIGWTRDPSASFVVGGAMLLVSVLGFIAWSRDFGRGRI